MKTITFLEKLKHEIGYIEEVSQPYSEIATKSHVDKMISIDPMEKFKIEDSHYMDAIIYAGAKLHSKDPVCCDNPKNHKIVPLITSAYKMCKICKSDLGDWVK